MTETKTKKLQILGEIYLNLNLNEKNRRLILSILFCFNKTERKRRKKPAKNHIYLLSYTKLKHKVALNVDRQHIVHQRI